MAFANALYERLREGQAILLEIFRAKGLLPSVMNRKTEAPPPDTHKPEMAAPSAPTGILLPFPSPPFPTPSDVETATAPTSVAEQQPSISTEEPAVSEADQEVLPSEVAHAQERTASEVIAADPAAAVSEEPPKSASADPGAGGAGG